MRSLAVLSLLIVLAMPAAAATDPSNDPSNVAPADPADTRTVGAVEAPGVGLVVVDLLRAHDLFGTFARDCGRPAAPNNPHVRVTQETGGLVIETHDFGLDSSANIYSVRAARRIAADRLELKVVFVPGSLSEEFQTLELMVGKGTRRTMFNRVDNGPVRVRQGVAVANGSKTPLLKKCS
jgi:hypothetical protein